MYYYFLISEDRINGISDTFAIFDNETDAIKVIKSAVSFPNWKIKTDATGKMYAKKSIPNPDEEKAVNEIVRYKVVEMERGQCDDEPLFFKSYEDYDEYYK